MITERALIVAFHFPPQAASSGIQRTLSFSRHLSSYGWEPLVLSAQPTAYELTSPAQLSSIPASVVVKRAFALDAKRHLSLFGRYFELSAMPDRWMSWWLGAVPVGLSMIRTYRPSVIWSTYPIATSHLIGLTLHRLTGVPWIADFRDPMIQPSFPKTLLQRRASTWVERQAIQRCTKAVFTTIHTMKSYRRRYPEIKAEKFVVIENGYDEDDFSAVRERQTPTPARDSQRPAIKLLHSGVLYFEGRNPSAFFEALAKLKAAGRINSNSLSVVLRATGEDEHFRQLTKASGIDDIVHVAPPIPYREALQEMLESDGLLVFQGASFNGQVPAKIYEYFRARRPILGLVDLNGETARILYDAGFPDLATMTSASEIAETLDRFLTKVTTGTAFVASDVLVEAASRHHRAGELAQVFSQASSGASNPFRTTQHP